MQLLLSVFIYWVVGANFWYKWVILSRPVVLEIRAEFAPSRTLGSWKSEKGGMWCLVEDRIITTTGHAERGKHPSLSCFSWSAVPVPCPTQRQHLIISDVPLGGYLHQERYSSVLKAENEPDSEICSGIYQQPGSFGFFLNWYLSSTQWYPKTMFKCWVLRKCRINKLKKIGIGLSIILWLP